MPRSPDNMALTWQQASLLYITHKTSLVAIWVPCVTAGISSTHHAWLIPLLVAPLTCILGLFAAKLQQACPGQTLPQIYRQNLGTIAGYLLTSGYFFWFCHLSALDLRISSDFIIGSFLPQTPISVVIFFIAACSALAARQGYNSIARSNQIICPIIFLILIAVFFLSLPNFDLSSFRPVFHFKAGHLAFNSLPLLAWFSEIVILVTMLGPHLSPQKPQDLPKMIGYSVLPSAFLVLATIVMVIATQGMEWAAKQPFPSLSVAGQIEIADFIERMEAGMMYIWLAGVFVRLAILFLWGALTLSQGLNLSDPTFLIFPLALAASVLSMMLGKNILEYRAFMKPGYFPLYSLVFTFFLPALAYVWIRIKRSLPSSKVKPFSSFIRAKKISFFIALFLLPLVLSGCWDSLEINKAAIATAIGLDTTPQGEIEFSVQIALPQAQNSPDLSEKPPYTVVTSSAPSLALAGRKTMLKIPRSILWQHASVVVIGEQLARQGLEGIIDEMARNRNLRPTDYILIAKGTTAKKVLSTPTKVEKIPATALSSMLRVQDKLVGIYTPITLAEFVSQTAMPGWEPAVPGVKVGVKEGKPHLMLCQTAVFNKGKLVGWLNPVESKGLRWLRPSMVQGGTKTISCPVCGEKVLTTTLRSTNSVKPEIRNGRLVMKITVQEESLFYEQRCLHQLVTRQMLRRLDRSSSRVIEEQIKDAITACQSLGADIFGFGDLVRKHHPQLWKEIGPKWEEYFSDLSCEIKAVSHIRRTGMYLETAVLKY